jgi:hypothetical protein
MNQRCRYRGSARPVLEPRARSIPIASKVGDDAGEQGGERLAGAVGRQQFCRAVAVGGDPVQAVATQRGGEHGGRARDIGSAAPLGGVHPMLGDIDSAMRELRAGGGERQRRVGGEDGAREAAEAVLDRVGAASLDRLEHAGPHELGGTLGVAGGQRVAQCSLAIARGGMPGACALVQLRLEHGVGAVQLRLEHLAEQAMVAEPVGGAVERHQREPRPPESRQHRGRSRPLEQRVAQRGGQHVEHGCPGHERPLLVGHAREHLVADVLGDQAVGTAEAAEPDGRNSLLGQ